MEDTPWGQLHHAMSAKRSFRKTLGLRSQKRSFNNSNMWTTSIFPALDEEHLHVVVGERVGGRDDTLFLVPPHESFEEAAELSSLQIF